MFKVNNKDTRTMSMVSFWNDAIGVDLVSIVNVESVSIVNFEHVIAGWDSFMIINNLVLNCTIKGYCGSSSYSGASRAPTLILRGKVYETNKL